ncbi:MAG: 2-oxoacid:acceptor oxidoreductase family protein [Candidatus Woesearchaeota archaeon]
MAEKDIFEIRFHGRGGQGAKTAAAIIADAALHKGKYIQSFPEYGAERKGAPVKAFTRISDLPIRIHSGVVNPDLVIVVDPTLIGPIPVTDGLDPEKGILLVNTPKSADEIEKMIGFSGKTYTVDATRISMELFGKNIPNTPLLGAIEKITNLVGLDEIKKQLEHKLKAKIGERMFKLNIDALDKAYEETKE